uniref:Uncharacterized protein n=1 Tax=Nicotiana tabacum TaxID=4097 RepID=A0A1S3ZWM9_TOBAC|nr:PREDICTED: uncharacterized protein LOC107791198 [Nicotiana tabacum]
MHKVIKGERTSLDFAYEELEENHYSPKGRMDLSEGHVVPLTEGDNDRGKVQPRIISNHGAELDCRARDPEIDKDRDRPRSKSSKIEIERDRGKLTDPNNGKSKYLQSGEDHGENPGHTARQCNIKTQGPATSSSKNNGEKEQSGQEQEHLPKEKEEWKTVTFNKKRRLLLLLTEARNQLRLQLISINPPTNNAKASFSQQKALSPHPNPTPTKASEYEK